MSGAIINTLAMTKRLVAEYGYTKKHAEGMAEVIIETMSGAQRNVATKDDIALLREEIKSLELRLTVKMGVMIVGAISLAAKLANMF